MRVDHYYFCELEYECVVSIQQDNYAQVSTVVVGAAVFCFLMSLCFLVYALYFPAQKYCVHEQLGL